MRFLLNCNCIFDLRVQIFRILAVQLTLYPKYWFTSCDDYNRPSKQSNGADIKTLMKYTAVFQRGATRINKLARSQSGSIDLPLNYVSHNFGAKFDRYGLVALCRHLQTLIGWDRLTAWSIKRSPTNFFQTLRRLVWIRFYCSYPLFIAIFEQFLPPSSNSNLLFSRR